VQALGAATRAGAREGEARRCEAPPRHHERLGETRRTGAPRRIESHPFAAP
jgi:hypothetical protein